jgi:hypothetical protein
MRCAACNSILTDHELSLRAPETGVFADLCTECYEISFDLKSDVTYNPAAIDEELNHEQDG